MNSFSVDSSIRSDDEYYLNVFFRQHSEEMAEVELVEERSYFVINLPRHIL